MPTEAFPALTDRDPEMLHPIARGAPTAEITGHLSLSSKTVADYDSGVLHKLQVGDRKQPDGVPGLTVLERDVP